MTRRITYALVVLLALACVGASTAQATTRPPDGLRVAMEQGGYSFYSTNTTDKGVLTFSWRSKDHKTLRFVAQEKNPGVKLVNVQTWRRFVVLVLHK